MSQTHLLHKADASDIVGLPFSGNSHYLSQSNLWQFLTQSDIAYLLNALPNLESPLSSPLSKLMTYLRAHSVSSVLTETILPHLVDHQTSHTANTPSDTGTRESVMQGDSAQSATGKRKKGSLQLESSEEETGHQSKKKRRGKKEIAANNARGDLPQKITLQQRFYSDHNYDATSDNQSQDQQPPLPRTGPTRKPLSTKKTKDKRGEAPEWTTTGPPPPLTDAVRTLAIKLCVIQQDIEHASFMEFLHGLTQPSPSLLEDLQSTSGTACLKRCQMAERASAIHDFYHMVALIQAAFWIESEKVKGKTIKEIANDNAYTRREVSNWFQQGTRLIALAGAGSFYIIIVLAFLKMKAEVIYTKGNYVTTIYLLSNVIRNPGMYCERLSDLLQKGLIPTIAHLYSDMSLNQGLVFNIHPQKLKDEQVQCINFKQLGLMEELLNNFQTNVFLLPWRSPIWRLVRPFGLQDWTSSEAVFTVPQPQIRTPQPSMKDLRIINTTFKLRESITVPFSTSSRQEWTARQRLIAAKAQIPCDLDEFSQLSVYKQGKRVKGYVKLPAALKNGVSIRTNDAEGLLLFLLASDSTGWLAPKLDHLLGVLEQVVPGSLSAPEKAFRSIHCDIWNRYAEKGDDAPPNTHPDNISKTDATKINFGQRMPYFSSVMKNTPHISTALEEALSDICDYVHKVVAHYLPEEYTEIKAFVDVLPLNHVPTSYPFASFVINIHAATKGHKDGKDKKFCCVVPFGRWAHGQLVLHEPGIVLDLTPGDVVIFPSCHITHFNLHIDGVRCSLTLFSDNHGQDWVRFRNGWQNYIVVKEPSSNSNASVEV